jgi:hypothetical protein
LNNTGDRLQLLNPDGVEVDSMSWDNDSTFLDPPATDVSDGHSLERDPDGTDTDTASDFVEREIPTPGS